MAGVDLPIKLRNALGKGKVVPPEELARMIAPFDADHDGQITRAELATFFWKHRLGGQWFASVVAKTLWGFVQTRMGKEVALLKVDVVARIVYQTMRRAPRPEKRYEITPEGMAGYVPLKPLEKRDRSLEPPPAPSGDARPRATPRGPVVEPARSQSQMPGRTGAPGPAGGAQARPAMRRPVPRRPGPRR